MFIKIIIWLVLFMVILVALTKYLEKTHIFFPDKNLDNIDKLPFFYQDIYIKTADNLLVNCWFIPSENSNYTILFAHGNAGNISNRIELINFLKNLGLSVMIFDYRGYGLSQGKPDENGIYQDTLAVYEYLIKEKNISYDRIIGYGESLGSAAIINLALTKPMAAIITEGAFTNIKDMAKINFPYLPTLFISTKFDSLSKIAFIDIPKMIIHSYNDKVVLFNLGQKLFNNAKPPKVFVQLKGAHCAGFSEDTNIYAENLITFIKTLNKNDKD